MVFANKDLPRALFVKFQRCNWKRFKLILWPSLVLHNCRVNAPWLRKYGVFYKKRKGRWGLLALLAVLNEKVLLSFHTFKIICVNISADVNSPKDCWPWPTLRLIQDSSSFLSSLVFSVCPLKENILNLTNPCISVETVCTVLEYIAKTGCLSLHKKIINGFYICSFPKSWWNSEVCASIREKSVLLLKFPVSFSRWCFDSWVEVMWGESDESI